MNHIHSMYACSKHTILNIGFNSLYILFQIPKWRSNSSVWSCRPHRGSQGTPRWLGCKVTDFAATGTPKTSISCCKIKGKLSSDLAYERWEKSLVFRKGNPRNESNVQWINIYNLKTLSIIMTASLIFMFSKVSTFSQAVTAKVEQAKDVTGHIRIPGLIRKDKCYTILVIDDANTDW